MRSLCTVIVSAVLRGLRVEPTKEDPKIGQTVPSLGTPGRKSARYHRRPYLTCARGDMISNPSAQEPLAKLAGGVITPRALHGQIVRSAGKEIYEPAIRATLQRDNFPATNLAPSAGRRERRGGVYSATRRSSSRSPACESRKGQFTSSDPITARPRR